MTFKKLKKFFILLLLLKSFPVLAQDVSLKAYLDKETISLDENVILFVEAHNLKTDTNDITPPLLENFMIIKADSYYKFIKASVENDSSIIKVFRFLLEPLKEGDFKIEPFVLNIDNEKVKTNSTFIEIQKSVIEQDMLQEFTYTTSQRDKIQKDFKLITSLSSNTIYQGQQIIIAFEFIRPVSVNINSLKYTYPSFKNFLVEPLPSKIKPEVFYQDNMLYKKECIFFALFPVSSGTYYLDPVSIDFNIMFYDENIDNYSYEKIKLFSQDHTFNVLPLPEKENIRNMVGICDNFTINLTCSNEKISLDQSTTVTIEITGHGLLEKKEFNLLTTNEIFEESLIADEMQTAVDEKNNIFTKRIIKKKLIPRQYGILKVDNIFATYFSPWLKEYKQVRLPDISINVVNNKLPQMPEKKVAIKTHKYPLKDIKTKFTVLPAKMKNPLTIILLIVSGLLFIILLFLVRKKIQYRKKIKEQRNPIQRSGRNKHRRL